MLSEIDGIPLSLLTVQPAGGGSNLLGQVFLLVLLIFANAFCAASEMAVVSLNEAKIKRMAEDGNKQAAKLLRLTANSSRFLATIQIGVTLAGFLSSASAAQSFAEPLAAAMSALPIPPATLESIATVLITVILSYFSLVFGELVPKKLALQRAESLALAVVDVLLLLSALFRPVVWFLTISTNFVAQLMGLNPNADDTPVTEEDILSMVDEGEESGVLEESAKDMITNIFDFKDTTVSELMTHRTEVVAVADTASVEDVIRVALDEGYSRIPVYHEDIDNIKGILYVKDLLRFVGNCADNISITGLMHDVYFVPEVKRCDELFTEMTEKKRQMAVVCDEYGGTSGIITMEDLLESIVGSIQDEYDDETEEIEQLTENTFTVDGTTSIGEVAELIDEDLPEGDYDTIAGFMLDQLGYIPDPGQHPVVEFGDCIFTVRELDDRRIASIHIERRMKQDSDDVPSPAGTAAD
ncbi:MAG: HlyC/CorC family transporter [Clostridia bacterium]|nr:HlyC/CorC family transporter [Clostridia bacterium]